MGTVATGFAADPLDHGKDRATACILCSHNCAIRVDVHAGEIVAVRADASSPITRGHICNKGFSIARYARHAQRVRQPLKRTPGPRRLS